MFIDDFVNSKYYMEVMNCRTNLIFNECINKTYSYHKDLEEDLNSYHFGAFENDSIIAYIRLSKSDNNGIVHFSRIFVKEDYRDKGFGSKLLCSLIKFCNEKKLKEIVLYSRLDAVDFYIKNCFKSTDEFIVSTESGLTLNKMTLLLDN